MTTSTRQTSTGNVVTVAVVCLPYAIRVSTVGVRQEGSVWLAATEWGIRNARRGVGVDRPLWQTRHPGKALLSMLAYAWSRTAIVLASWTEGWRHGQGSKRNDHTGGRAVEPTHGDLQGHPLDGAVRGGNGGDGGGGLHVLRLPVTGRQHLHALIAHGFR
jgi:hypothetical protein